MGCISVGDGEAAAEGFYMVVVALLPFLWCVVKILKSRTSLRSLRKVACMRTDSWASQLGTPQARSATIFSPGASGTRMEDFQGTLTAVNNYDILRSLQLVRTRFRSWLRTPSWWPCRVLLACDHCWKQGEPESCGGYWNFLQNRL